ncbi:MAG TPA: CDP-alcohol phosphatidyltransferase family protein [Gaiellaceae bacterium]|nr:CDP-alcohol phosphatidyltransferase family protein [Gaiellaceae bacterium]
MTTSALLFATAAAADGRPAAALPARGSTLLVRLLATLESLDVRRAWVVTRPGWREAVEEAARGAGVDVTVVESEDQADDLRAVAGIAADAPGRLLVGNAHAVTHREALAGLLADPRIVSGILGTGSHGRGLWSYRVRIVRGRVVSAGSPYHRVGVPNSYFLGFLKVDPHDRAQLVAAAREFAELVTEPRPNRWDDQMALTVADWRARLWRMAIERETGEFPDPMELPPSIRLDPDTEAEVSLRVRAAREDVVALLLVGLVRSGVHLSRNSLRGFFYATPLSVGAAETAMSDMEEIDEDRVALDAAVKAQDGFFTTFFVSPYSKYMARFAARRGWTPNAMTTVSFVIGVASAASFAVGTRVSLVLGAVLLHAAFTVDCVDGQLARHTRTFSKLGAWLDSVFDRSKEYVVYAGLAIGATRGFGDDVWLLAAAAVTLQTFRHMVDFAYAARQHEAIEPTLPLDDPEDAPLTIDLPARPRPSPVAAFAMAEGAGGTTVVAPAPASAVPAGAGAASGTAERPAKSRVTLSSVALSAVAAAGALDRRSWTRWGKRILVLPIGERFALIAVTAAIWNPRVTFIALLAWGGVAAAYAVAGRTLAALAR